MQSKSVQLIQVKSYQVILSKLNNWVQYSSFTCKVIFLCNLINFNRFMLSSQSMAWIIGRNTWPENIYFFKGFKTNNNKRVERCMKLLSSGSINSITVLISRTFPQWESAHCLGINFFHYPTLLSHTHPPTYRSCKRFQLKWRITWKIKKIADEYKRVDSFARKSARKLINKGRAVVERSGNVAGGLSMQHKNGLQLVHIAEIKWGPMTVFCPGAALWYCWTQHDRMRSVWHQRKHCDGR